MGGLSVGGAAAIGSVHRIREPFAIEFEEDIFPRIEAQKRVVAMSEDATGGKEGFDCGQSRVGVLVHFGAAWVGGFPVWRNGARLHGFHCLANLLRMPPVRIQQEKGPPGIGKGKDGGIRRQQKVLRQIRLLAKGIGHKGQPRGAAQGLNRALGAGFTASDDDENRGWHTRKGKRFRLCCKGVLFHYGSEPEKSSWRE